MRLEPPTHTPLLRYKYTCVCVHVQSGCGWVSVWVGVKTKDGQVDAARAFDRTAVNSGMISRLNFPEEHRATFAAAAAAKASPRAGGNDTGSDPVRIPGHRLLPSNTLALPPIGGQVVVGGG